MGILFPFPLRIAEKYGVFRIWYQCEVGVVVSSVENYIFIAERWKI